MARVPVNSIATFHVAKEGKVGKVLLSPRAKDEYDRVTAANDQDNIQRAVQLNRHFENFADLGGTSLNPGQFRRLGAYKTGTGKKVAIWEFKARQWRLFGAVVTHAGKSCFVGVRVNPDKKKQKADSGLVEAAAKDIGALVEFSG